MMQARGVDEQKTIIEKTTQAQSLAYSLDLVSMPLEWYKGTAFAGIGLYDESRQCFEKAYNVHPYNRFVLNDLATAYVLNHDYDRAEKLYQEAQRISRHYDEPALNLIALYIETKQWSKIPKYDSALRHYSSRRTELKSIWIQYLKPGEYAK